MPKQPKTADQMWDEDYNFESSFGAVAERKQTKWKPGQVWNGYGRRNPNEPRRKIK